MATFDSEVSLFVTGTWERLSKHYRRTAVQLYTDIVDGTPRDTGTLKNSFRFGTAVTGEKPEKRKYRKGAEKTQILKAQAAAQGIEPHEAIFIFSNMEYAEAVERGLGPGAREPRRMVANAIQKMIADMAKP